MGSPLIGIPDVYRLAIKNGEIPKDELLEKRGYVDLKSISESQDGILTVDFVITTGAVDRDQDSINPDGWDFTNFDKNPVVLWAHDHKRPPVANSTRIWRDGDAWKSTAAFMPPELSGFSHSVGQMYKAGFLHAVSVGFRGIESKWAPDETNRPWGIDFIRQELYEYSCCAVPANPEALVAAKSAGVDVAPLLRYVEESLETVDYIPRETAERIYKVLSAKSVVRMPPMRQSHKAKLDEISAQLKKYEEEKSC